MSITLRLFNVKFKGFFGLKYRIRWKVLKSGCFVMFQTSESTIIVVSSVFQKHRNVLLITSMRRFYVHELSLFYFCCIVYIAWMLLLEFETKVKKTVLLRFTTSLLHLHS